MELGGSGRSSGLFPFGNWLSTWPHAAYCLRCLQVYVLLVDGISSGVDYSACVTLAILGFSFACLCACFPYGQDL